jgi:NAD(P)-dependent dehydrogenase (short-subunit alcohol dehydrogenase family)
MMHDPLSDQPVGYAAVELRRSRLRMGRVALVTGGSSGIGRASARAFAAAGYAVVVADVDDAGGAETVRGIEADGGSATYVHADMTEVGDVAALVPAALRAYGRLDAAHNNAGIGGEPAPTAEYPLDGWHRILAVNLTGTFLCMRHEIAHMLEAGGGAIVNTASTFGLVGVPGMAAYTATKHGIVGLTRGAALEYATHGIRINAICPGATRTPQLEEFFGMLAPGDPDAAAADFAAREPVGRLGRPEEIAAAAVWLCSDAASFVTGLAMPVDGGWTAQ